MRALYEREGVSTILVVGGSGAYLDVADCVISMKNYQPYDITEQARVVAAAHPNPRPVVRTLSLSRTQRIPQPGGLELRRGTRRYSARAHGRHKVTLGRETIDMRYVAQLVDIVESIMEDIAQRGLDCLDKRLVGDLVLFRRYELAAAINRLRLLEMGT